MSSVDPTTAEAEPTARDLELAAGAAAADQAGMGAHAATEDPGLVEDRRRLFWALQLGGWGAFFLVNYVGTLPFDKPPAYTLYQFAQALSGILFSLLLRSGLRSMWHWPPLRMAVGLLFTVYGCAVGWTLVSNLVFYGAYSRRVPTEWTAWLDGGLYATWVLLCWTGIYFGIKYYRLVQVEREHALRAETLAHEAQLKMLRYQLNPHFLFNTLNAISTLILDEDRRRARGMVNRLSDFLRYSLESDPMQKTTLRQELDALRLYLDIEEVRFAERLRVELRSSAEAEDALVPSLVLQPLVENAIKYAIAPSEDGGRIRLTAATDGRELLLTLEDDGPGLGGASTSTGVGLANTRERLRQMYGEAASLTLEDGEQHGLMAVVRIPYEPSRDEHQGGAP